MGCQVSCTRATNARYFSPSAVNSYMSRLKSFFISAYISALSLALVWAMLSLLDDPSSLSHWGIFLSNGAPLVFFARLFLAPIARTSVRLAWMPLIGLIGSGIALAGDGLGVPFAVALFNGVLLSLTYIHWYSKFEKRSVDSLAVGEVMPDLSFLDVDGQALFTAQLTRQTALWLFYRGNWCPLCMAQISEVAAEYRQLQARGVEIYLISPQPQEHSRSLADRFQVPMRFLQDLDNHAASRLGILSEGGLPLGLQALGYDSDVPMPTVFITAPGGRIVYSDLTDNYRIRPEPSEFIKALDMAGL